MANCADFKPGLPVLIGYRGESVFENAVERIGARIDCNRIFLNDWIYRDGFSVERSSDNALLISGERDRIAIAADTPIYHRLFVRGEDTAAAMANAQRLYREFCAYVRDVHDTALVINRPGAGASNQSKYAHGLILAEIGFRVPRARIASHLELLDAGSWPKISKGCSGLRTEARLIERRDLPGGLAHRQSAPVLLQDYVPGFDVRVHWVGVDHLALKLESEADDYRYAERKGYVLEASECEMPPALCGLCWTYMTQARLDFAAFDFRVDEEGIWWLLEVNPMPGYAFFDRKVDGKLSIMLADYLARGFSNVSDPPNPAPSPFIGPDRRPGLSVGNLF